MSIKFGEWISMKEALPPYQKTVLLLVEGKHTICGWWYPEKSDDFYYDYPSFCDYDDGDDLMNDKVNYEIEKLMGTPYPKIKQRITHWMPLPTSPGE